MNFLISTFNITTCVAHSFGYFHKLKSCVKCNFSLVEINSATLKFYCAIFNFRMFGLSYKKNVDNWKLDLLAHTKPNIDFRLIWNCCLNFRSLFNQVRHYLMRTLNGYRIAPSFLMIVDNWRIHSRSQKYIIKNGDIEPKRAMQISIAKLLCRRMICRHVSISEIWTECENIDNEIYFSFYRTMTSVAMDFRNGTKLTKSFFEQNSRIHFRLNQLTFRFRKRVSVCLILKSFIFIS